MALKEEVRETGSVKLSTKLLKMGIRMVREKREEIKSKAWGIRSKAWPTFNGQRKEDTKDCGQQSRGKLGGCCFIRARERTFKEEGMLWISWIKWGLKTITGFSDREVTGDFNDSCLCGLMGGSQNEWKVRKWGQLYIKQLWKARSHQQEEWIKKMWYTYTWNITQQ